MTDETPARVHLDGPQRRRGTTVAWCDACPPWREVRNDRPAAQRAAALHLEAVHGDTRQAADLRAAATAALRAATRPPRRQ